MFDSVKRFLGATVLVAGLTFGTPTMVAAATPPVPEQIEVVKTEEIKPETVETTIIDFRDSGPSYLEKIMQEEEKVNFNIDFRLFTLNTMWFQAKPGSLLSYVRDEEIVVPVLGASVDYVFAETDKVNGWQGSLSLNSFVEFSSTDFFMTPLEHKGYIQHQGLLAKYDIKGDMKYFGVGLGFVPTINYHVGPARLGVFFEARGGLTYLDSSYTFMAGPYDPHLRKMLEEQNINPDITGEINLRGMGGFLQFMVGPSFGLYNLFCRGGVGVRINSFPNLAVHEQIGDSPFLGPAQDSEYDAEYGDITPVFGGTCGFGI